MDTTTALLDSWDRQCRIVSSVASLVDEANRSVRPSPDGWPLDAQLAHIHQVRRYWLSRFSPKHAEGLGRVFKDGWENPIDDLGAIKSELDRSAKAVRDAVAEGIEAGGAPAGGYDHPVIFLQHMVWHEGWHVGLLMLGLRVAGQEPPEEWEEPNVWGQWRVE